MAVCCVQGLLQCAECLMVCCCVLSCLLLSRLGGQAAQHSSACRLDPRMYACVLIHITLQVQNVIDVWASAGERIQLAFSWTDPLATAVLVVVMLLLALGLWVLGLQVLVTVGLLWVFR